MKNVKNAITAFLATIANKKIEVGSYDNHGDTYDEAFEHGEISLAREVLQIIQDNEKAVNIHEAIHTANNQNLLICPINMDDGTRCPYMFSVVNYELIDVKGRTENVANWIDNGFIVLPKE